MHVLGLKCVFVHLLITSKKAISIVCAWLSGHRYDREMLGFKRFNYYIFPWFQLKGLVDYTTNLAKLFNFNFGNSVIFSRIFMTLFCTNRFISNELISFYFLPLYCYVDNSCYTLYIIYVIFLY